jgi:hypothetical protein
MADEGDDIKPKPPGNHRIEGRDMPSLYLMAGFFDLLSMAFSPAAPIIAIFGQITLSIAWILHGIWPWGKKYWLWYLVTWIIEFIPIINMFPTFLMMVNRYIALSRIEDKFSHLLFAAKLDRTKTLVRRALQTKGVKDIVKKAEKASVTGAAKRKDGSFDRGAIRDKRQALTNRRADLDKALAPEEKGKRNFSGVVDRLPEFMRPKSSRPPSPANDAAPPERDAA